MVFDIDTAFFLKQNHLRFGGSFLTFATPRQALWMLPWLKKVLFVGASDGVVGRLFVACTADILQLVLNVKRCQFLIPQKCQFQLLACFANGNHLCMPLLSTIVDITR